MTVTFYLYTRILFRAFIELQDGIKISKSCQEKISDTFCLRKHFYHKPQESLPDTTLVLLESRRVALSSHSYSRALKCLKSAR